MGKLKKLDWIAAILFFAGMLLFLETINLGMDGANPLNIATVFLLAVLLFVFGYLRVTRDSNKLMMADELGYGKKKRRRR